MTFTYTEDLTLDVDFVRFHTGDVDSAAALLSDELITSMIAVVGTKEEAVIAGLNHMILRLNTPNFTADWLKVDPSKMVDTLIQRAKDKAQELGVNVGGITVNTRAVYRADSAQTSEPDYSEGA